MTTQNHDEQGKFAKGNTLGQGRKPSIFQDYGPRAEHFLQTLTRSQILALSDDPIKLDAYSSFDAMILEQLANTFRKPKFNDPAMERERLMDRAHGKPKQPLTGGDEGDSPLFPQKVEIVLVAAKKAGEDQS